MIAQLHGSEPYFAYCIRDLPDPPSYCSVLAVNASTRSNPGIKATSWIRERQTLVALKGEKYNEVLLVNNEGLIYEGLSSNFGVIKAGCLLTAPDSVVLPGTVMQLVKQSCNALGIPVIEQCPNIEDVHSWQAAFITSTSRLLLPVYQLDYNNQYISFQQDCSIIKMLQEQVDKLIN